MGSKPARCIRWARGGRHPGRRLSLFGIAVAIVVVAAAGAGIWDRREEVVRQAHREAAALAFVVAAETDRSMGSVDRALGGIETEVRSVGAGDPDRAAAWMVSADARHLLRRTLRELPQADFVALVAADGRRVIDAGSPPGAVLEPAVRDCFAQLRDRPHGGPCFSAPASTGIPPLVVAGRLDAGNGRFLGIAMVAITADTLARFYRSLVGPSGGAVRLERRDGVVLDRYVPPGSEGAPRFGARQPVAGFDLAVVVALPEAKVLARWWAHAAVIAGAAVALAVALALLLRALAVRSRSLERSEAELRASEARFRDFALTSSDWFWETDAQHRFVYQSEEIREFGQNPENRRGRLRIDLAADVEKEPEKWREHMAVLNRHEPFRDFVYERQVGADPPHIIAVSGNPAFDGQSRFVGYRGTARNITEQVLGQRRLRAAKAEAEAANLAKSQFLANIGHDLRTPLDAILGFAQLLECGKGGPLEPRAREYAELIGQSGAHLLAVIDDLLDLARIDAGKLELQEEHGLDPRLLVRRCLAMVEPQADAAELALAAEIAEPVPLITADRTRLTEILLNLLSNAIKFTEPGGKVAMALLRGPVGEVIFEVRDNGIGMTGPEVEIAFEPFGQVDPGRSRRSAGTGLGLPLARRLAELHGGGLELKSEKGVGTTARLVLPATRVVAAAETGADPA